MLDRNCINRAPALVAVGNRWSAVDSGNRMGWMKHHGGVKHGIFNLVTYCATGVE